MHEYMSKGLLLGVADGPMGTNDLPGLSYVKKSWLLTTVVPPPLTASGLPTTVAAECPVAAYTSSDSPATCQLQS